MDFNENNIKKSNEKVERVNLQNDLYLGNQKSLHAKNGIKWLLGQSFAIMYYNICHLIFCFMNINKPFRIKMKITDKIRRYT